MRTEKFYRIGDAGLDSYKDFVYAGINKDFSEFDPWKEDKEVIGSKGLLLPELENIAKIDC